MTAVTAAADKPRSRSVPWRRLAVAALPGGIYLVVRTLGVLWLWGIDTLNGNHLDLHVWDGDWYLAIAQHGYAGVPTNMMDANGHHTAATAMVFFPGYPQLVHVTAWVFGGNYFLTGIGVSVAAGVAASFAVARLAARFGSRRTELVAVVLFAAAPMSSTFALAYPDALLIAPAAWALVGVMENRWWLAGLAAVAAGYVSPMAAPVIITVMAAGLAAVYRGRATWSASIAAMMAPVGMLGYLIWVDATSGVPGGYFAIQRAGWGSGIDFGWHTARWFWQTISRDDSAFTLVTVAISLAAIGLLAWSWRRIPWELWTYSLLAVGVALGTDGIMFAKARLLLAAFPLLLPLAARIASKNTRITVVLATGIALFGLWFSTYALTAWQHSI